MNLRHILHGRIKNFWIFLVITSLVAFTANVATQMLSTGMINLNNAISTSLAMGIVLAIIMSTYLKKK